jgi:hypothetical protein
MAKKSGIDLWLDGIEPKLTFSVAENPPGPDYASAHSWAACPENMGKAAFAPDDETAIDPSLAVADVFYVHPTTYVGEGNWNADVSGPMHATRADEIVAEMIMPGHASLFNGCCRIYAPRYRQANLAVFFRPGNNGRAALDLAYSDVARAFEYYITHENQGRPFFLAGHSQGCALLKRLLAVGFEPHLKDKLIAAYLLGFKVTKEAAESFSHIAVAANNESDAGVFVAYDTFLEGIDAVAQRDYAETWLPTGWQARMGKNILGINPVNWSPVERSAVGEHLGYGIVEVNDPALLPHLYLAGPDDGVGLRGEALVAPLTPGVAAKVDAHGFLKISKPSQDFMNAGVFGGNYHNKDVSLFYMNLRRNIEARVTAFVSAN